MSKKTIEKKTKKQDKIDEFIELAYELKEIVVNLNQRLSELESSVDKVKSRLGL
jgi:wobble nucleotide-excising tRNase